MITTATLKNAARALGYDLWSDPDVSHYLVDYDGVKLKRWEPEHSSEDSFELMIALGLETYTGSDELGNPEQYVGYSTKVRDWAAVCEPHKENPLGASRIAILRAASEIGAAL